MESVVIPKFNVKDYWNRIEWQARGAPHDHGFVWCKGAPKCDIELEESREVWARFWGMHMNAVNMDPFRVEDGNCLTLPMDQRPVTFDFLSKILMRVQIHICKLLYCIREKKRDGNITAGQARRTLEEVREINRVWLESHAQLSEGLSRPALEALNAAGKLLQNFQCRFYFPRATRDEAVTGRDLNPKHWSFVAARNDERLNQYNATLSLGWMANLDISLCADATAVKNYMAKYCGKAETQSMSFLDLSRKVMGNVNQRAPLLSFVSKFLNKLLGERDWSY